MMVYYSGGNNGGDNPETRRPHEVRGAVPQAVTGEGVGMLFYYHASADPIQQVPERVLGRRARLMLSYRDVKLRRHHKYFRQIVRARGARR